VTNQDYVLKGHVNRNFATAQQPCRPAELADGTFADLTEDKSPMLEPPAEGGVTRPPVTLRDTSYGATRTRT